MVICSVAVHDNLFHNRISVQMQIIKKGCHLYIDDIPKKKGDKNNLSIIIK